MTKREYVLRFFLFAMCLFAVGFSVMRPKEASSAALSALELCAKRVVPSIFLFMAAAKIFSRLGGASLLSRLTNGVFEKLLGLSPSGGAALFLGLLSGYPAGAVLIAQFLSEGRMEREEAERILPFVTAASPAFLLGAASGMLGSRADGAALFSAQLISSLALLLLTRKKGGAKGRLSEKEEYPLLSAVTSSVRECGGTALAICSFVTFFGVFSAMAMYFLPSGAPAALRAAISGLLEISCGFAYARGLEEGALRAFICGAFTGFGGISVFMQSADALCACGVSMKRYLLGKCAQALLCGTLCAAIKSFPFRKCASAALLLFGEEEGRIRALWELFVNFTVFAAVICAILLLVLKILQIFSKK